LILLLFSPVSAQELIVIRAGRLIDVEKVEVLHDKVIYVRGDKIERIASLPDMVKYGMTPIGAIQSATINAARNIGWEDRVGSIAPRKFADIIVVEGDALSDLSRFMNVAFIMKAGQIVKSPDK
jgi:imidazolonepropionase-like amidohydrolase